MRPPAVDAQKPGIEISEGGQTDIQLSPADHLTLRERFAGRIDLSPAGPPDVYTLRVRDYAGRMSLPDGRLLVIRPKAGAANLFYMLCLDAGLAEFYAPPSGLSPDAEIYPFIVSSFLTEVRKLAAQGLNLGYFPVETDLPHVRGQIAVGPQISRYADLRHRHVCRFADHSADTAENQVLLSALLLVPALCAPREQELARRARYLARRFEGVTTIRAQAALKVLAAVPVGRLNLRYGSALRLARLLLSHVTLDNRTGSHPFASFLINMPRLFESFLTIRLSALLPEWGLRVLAQHRDYLDEQRQIGIRPDILVFKHRDREPLLVVDAKYRLPDESDLSRDLYQVSAYLDRYALERGVLVYPRFNRSDRSTLKLRNTPKHLHLLSLDIDSETPALLDRACRQLAEQLAGLAQTAD